MSKKFKKAAAALAGIGAAYLGSKMLGKKGLDKIDMNAVYDDMPSPKSKTPTVMPKPKPTSSRMPRSKNRFMGMNFGVSETPSNIDAFKEAEAKRKKATGFGRNVGKTKYAEPKSMSVKPMFFSEGSGKKGVTAKCKLGRNKKTKLY